MDALYDVDWEEHWAQVVRASQAWSGGGTAIFDTIASSYAYRLSENPDLLLEVTQPFLGSRKTLIDVGAGTGRHVVPLSAKLGHIFAVEPSAGMREHIPPLANVTLIPLRWEEAEVGPADLVICSHVLYGIAKVVPFIDKMQRLARERLFIYLRDEPHRHPANLLYEQLTGQHRPRHPQLTDLFVLLRRRGIMPDVVMARDPWRHQYADMEMAIQDFRARLGDAWDASVGESWLRERLIRQSDGTLLLERGEGVAGVLHWAPAIVS